MAPPRKSPFEEWQDTINRSRVNKAWNGYDATIQQTVNAYNAHLRTTTGFTPLSWKLVKAMVWTESGGPSNPAWLSRPMQIGNTGDPGLAALLGGKEGGDLIMPPKIAAVLTAQNASLPERNIQAGVGYLLMRAANYTFVNVEDKADVVHDYVIKSGDTFSSIAQAWGSTIAELDALNPSAKTLHIGQKVKVRKAKISKKIAGFKKLDTAAVAKLYNTKDALYADKLDYCLKVMG
jgi:hypothetical protein